MKSVLFALNNPDVMQKANHPNVKPKRGRPPLQGKKKVKASFTISPTILDAATKQAFKNNQSVSQFISASILAHLLES